MSKQMKVILLSFGVIVLVAFFSTGKRKEWYIVDYDFEILSEVDVSVSIPSNLRLNACVKNRSSVWYYFPSIEYSVEKMHDGRWMYWAEEPLSERTATVDILVGKAIWSYGEANFEVDLRDHLPCPNEPGLYRITFFFVSTSGVLYQKSAEFNLK